MASHEELKKIPGVLAKFCVPVGSGRRQVALPQQGLADKSSRCHAK
jgi:hypothetical protein